MTRKEFKTKIKTGRTILIKAHDFPYIKKYLVTMTTPLVYENDQDGYCWEGCYLDGCYIVSGFRKLPKFSYENYKFLDLLWQRNEKIKEVYINYHCYKKFTTDDYINKVEAIAKETIQKIKQRW